MRATFRKDHETGLLRAFLLSILFGGTVTPSRQNPNHLGDLSKFDDDSLRLVIDEGRRQLDNQNDRFRHATERAQLLMTVALALLGFLAAQLTRIGHVHGDRRWVFWAAWAIATLISLMGTGAAAATVVVKASFTQIDTTQITNWTPPVLRQLADDYADSVILGETTVAARVTVFRQATRLVMWGAIVAAVAFGVSF